MPIRLRSPQSRHRKASAWLAATAVVAAGLLAAAVAPPAQATVPSTIPLTLNNSSGLNEPVYLYDLGTDLATGQQGWADVNGAFHPWPSGSVPPSPAPDASIPGPADGQSITIRIPQFSGRIYFSYGQKLNFFLATGGLVQPAVWNPTDPNKNILFNWAEYTLNSSGLWLNSTQVDMFSAPYHVGVQRSDGTVATTGELEPGGYTGFFDSLKADPVWASTVQENSDGTVLRALAPSHAIEAGLLPANVMDDYINRVWNYYSTATLTVTPFADQPNTTYYGHVTNGVMNFVDSSGAPATSFRKPDSDSVLSCSNLLDAPNDLVRGPISRTLCAGFNRTTLLTNESQPDAQPADYYQDQDSNLYARDVHARMLDGKAYAFAFDDVADQESLVYDANPQQAYVSLDPMSASGSPSPSSSPSASASGSPSASPRSSPSGSASASVSASPSSSGGAGSSPTLYLQSDGSVSGSAASAATSATIASAGGGNFDGTPTNALTYTATGVNLTYNGGSTAFDLPVDAGTAVGDGVQVRVSYDCTGSGSWDRVETYHYDATDPVAGYEHYTQAAGLEASSGSLCNLVNGTVRVQIWNAIGSTATTLGTGNQAVITLPYS